MRNIKYRIGQEYHYPNCKIKFKLIEVYDGWKFKFSCGHWCTDNVFLDLINCSTGIQVFNDNQLQLF